MLGEDGKDEQTASGDGLVVGELLGQIGVEPKAERDEHEDAGAEKEAALPFEARFAEQPFESTIGHRIIRGRSCPNPSAAG